MKQEQKFKVVMLPTEKESEIIKIGSGITKVDSYSPSYIELHGYKYQHLYIVSNDEIKEGDLCWNQYNGESEICVGEVGKEWHKSMVKIIASTDKSITPNSWIPKKFVETYIEDYNFRGCSPPIEVSLEMAMIPTEFNNPMTNPEGLHTHDSEYEIKTRPDGSVIVKQPKMYLGDDKEFTRRQVEDKLEKILIDYSEHLDGNGVKDIGKYDTFVLSKWIEENL